MNTHPTLPLLFDHRRRIVGYTRGENHVKTTSAGNGEAVRAEDARSCARISQASDAVSVVRLNAREERAEFS